MGLFLSLINLKFHWIWLEIFTNNTLLKDAENDQKEIKILLNKLRKYNPTRLTKVNAKEETLSFC